MLKPFYINIISKLLELSPDILLGLIFPLAVLVLTSILMWRYVRKQNSRILELQSKNEELKELLKNASNSAKELFDELTVEKQKNKNLISKINREINTSVNGILGMANLLTDSELNAEQIKNTNAVIKSAEKLLQNTKEIFDGNNGKDPVLLNNIIMNDHTRPNKPKHPVSHEFATEFPIKILVAEDDQINQHLAVKMLNKLGYKPDIVSSGKEALEIVSEKQYDLILMDGLMPEMDGFEATKMIRLCLETQPIIIALTASTMYGDKEKCLQAGMDDYLSKPIDINHLAAIIEKWAMKNKAVV
ncbi:MAG TPA: response regulator [Parafilimonas sp.]|nr:response regulator [Parafilimonas sp.]